MAIVSEINDPNSFEEKHYQKNKKKKTKKHKTKKETNKERKKRDKKEKADNKDAVILSKHEEDIEHMKTSHATAKKDAEIEETIKHETSKKAKKKKREEKDKHYYKDGVIISKHKENKHAKKDEEMEETVRHEATNEHTTSQATMEKDEPEAKIDETTEKKKKAKKKKTKKHKQDPPEPESNPKRKRKRMPADSNHTTLETVTTKKPKTLLPPPSSSSSPLSFPHRYILAPMVGASELPFRLLCRKYGTQLAYTPMIDSIRFASEPAYRSESFQTVPEDRPLVAHFSANDPHIFAQVARMVVGRCDAIDLNLGCPQRTAYLGHFGSYLLGKEDRDLVVSIVRATVRAVPQDFPVFCKIRLLDTTEETIDLCRDLRDAGAALIAVHARYRASFERKGAGARDGPALLDRVALIREALDADAMGGVTASGDATASTTGAKRKVRIIANGNIVDWDDVVSNLKTTGADGVMSAEGILDNPALFLDSYCKNEDSSHDEECAQTMVQIDDPSPLLLDLEHGTEKTTPTENVTNDEAFSSNLDEHSKEMRKLTKKLRQIEAIEAKLAQEKTRVLLPSQMEKLASKSKVLERIQSLQQNATPTPTPTPSTNNTNPTNTHTHKRNTKTVPLAALRTSSSDPLTLASEYLTLATTYPTTLRTIIFHIRRMCKQLLTTYQLLQDCIDCKSIPEIQSILDRIRTYRSDPASFRRDAIKTQQDIAALAERKRREASRRRYEERMVRKAKREGKSDLEYYLRIGSTIPTVTDVARLRSLASDAERLRAWKDGDHAQHCLAYHVKEGGCERDRSCGFLHVDARGGTNFVEGDEVAG